MRLRTLITAAAIGIALTTGACSSADETPVAPTNEKQIHEGISASLTKLTSALPGSVYLSQRNPLDKVDHSIGPVTPDVKCQSSELRYSISYWLKGINVSEEQKYADLIEGVWARTFDWPKDATDPDPSMHAYAAPGGYRYIVAVDDAWQYRGRTTAAVWINAESPCLAKDAFDGEWMPEILKQS